MYGPMAVRPCRYLANQGSSCSWGRRPQLQWIMYVEKQCVTYVPEHLLPMSRVNRRTRFLAVEKNNPPP